MTDLPGNPPPEWYQESSVPEQQFSQGVGYDYPQTGATDARRWHGHGAARFALAAALLLGLLVGGAIDRIIATSEKNDLKANTAALATKNSALTEDVKQLQGQVGTLTAEVTKLTDQNVKLIEKNALETDQLKKTTRSVEQRKRDLADLAESVSGHTAVGTYIGFEGVPPPGIKAAKRGEAVTIWGKGTKTLGDLAIAKTAKITTEGSGRPIQIMDTRDHLKFTSETGALNVTVKPEVYHSFRVVSSASWSITVQPAT